VTKRVTLLAKTKETRDDRKLLFIARMGGACVDCGIKPGPDWPVAVFDFHHTDPARKDKSVARLMAGKDADRAWAEAQSCVVLCSNCHRRRHAIGSSHAPTSGTPDTGAQRDASYAAARAITMAC
jgi:hypothetical protein